MANEWSRQQMKVYENTSKLLSYIATLQMYSSNQIDKYKCKMVEHPLHQNIINLDQKTEKKRTRTHVK